LFAISEFYHLGHTQTAADRLFSRLAELNTSPTVLDKQTILNINYLFKDINFSAFPKRQLMQFIQAARAHLTSSTCRNVANTLHYALGEHINYRVYYAFRDTTPYAIKIPADPTRSVDDMLEAWQTKGPAITISPTGSATAVEEEDEGAEDTSGDDEKPAAMPLQAVASVFLTIVYAIRYLNSLKLCHSAIKPGNILIDSTGRMVLSDLGAVVRYGEPLMVLIFIPIPPDLLQN
jgi:serine/threonine protein kinase